MSRNLKKLVSITPYATYPPKMGGQVVIDAMNREFPALDWQVDQFSMGIRKSDLALIGRTKKIVVMPGYTEWRRTEPLTVAAFSVFSMLHLGFLNAGALLKRRGWVELERSVASCQAVLFESPWCYEVGALPPPQGIPVVYMAHNAEFQLAEMYREQKKALTKRAADFIELREEQILREADMVLAITAQDAEALCVRYDLPTSKMNVVPRGIYLDRFPILSESEKSALRDKLGFGDQVIALFVGSAHGPNLTAAESLIKISDQISDNVLIIIAGRAAKSFKGQDRKNLRFIPEAPQPFLQVADIALNPMMTGSGLNIKMLEYFGLELPCITTSFGARGLEGHPGEDYLITELDDFADAINLLAKNPALREKTGKNGRLLAEKKYSARVTAEAVLKLIEDWKHDYANRASH